jgi:pimeloyl-ACP methyl ester carboxylesterase
VSKRAGFTQIDEWRIAYETRGAGDRAIVFVHGWSADRSHWHAQLDGIASTRRLVAMDLLGHGESDKPEVKYTTQLLARCVTVVMDELEIERAVLVGHSNGVPVVREYYRLHPDRTEALVAVEGPLRQILTPQTKEWMQVRLQDPDYEKVVASLANQMPAGELSDEDLARIRAGVLATPKHVMQGGLDAMSDAATWQEDEIAVPLLVVLAKSPQWTDDYEQFVRRIAPQVEYHVWEGVTHFLFMERPGEFNAMLEKFLSRVV